MFYNAIRSWLLPCLQKPHFVPLPSASRIEKGDMIYTHIAAYTNPVRMSLSTRRAQHFEGVKIRLVRRIQGTKVSDTAVLSTTNLGSKISIPCEICCQCQRQHGSRIRFDRRDLVVNRKLTISITAATRDSALFLSFGRSVLVYGVILTMSG